MKSLRGISRCCEFWPGKLIGCSPKIAGGEEDISFLRSLNSANIVLKQGTQLIQGMSQFQQGNSIHVPLLNIHRAPKRDSLGSFDEAES